MPLGVVEELEAKGIKNTGTMGMGGSVSTAGGLVFIAATNDRRFRAFDAKTGKVVWETQMEPGGYAHQLSGQGRQAVYRHCCYPWRLLRQETKRQRHRVRFAVNCAVQAA